MGSRTGFDLRKCVIMPSFAPIEIFKHSCQRLRRGARFTAWRIAPRSDRRAHGCRRLVRGQVGGRGAGPVPLPRAPVSPDRVRTVIWRPSRAQAGLAERRAGSPNASTSISATSPGASSPSVATYCAWRVAAGTSSTQPSTSPKWADANRGSSRRPDTYRPLLDQHETASAPPGRSLTGHLCETLV
jgi:hypothetical protein